MKIGIPSMGKKGLEEKIGEHFGRVPYYTIIDLETGDLEVIENTSHHMGGQGQPPELLKEHGVEVMICQGLGRRAIDLFSELGINVCVGATGTVKDVVESYKSGRLQEAASGDACQKHAFRGEGKH